MSRVHGFEVNGGGEEHHHGDGVEYALKQPNRDHPAHGNVFLLGNISGTNKFAGASPTRKMALNPRTCPTNKTHREAALMGAMKNRQRIALTTKVL